MKKRTSNTDLVLEIRELKGMIVSMLQVIGGMSYMRAQEVRPPGQPSSTWDPSIGVGSIASHPPLTEEQKAISLQKAKAQAEKIKEQMELGIQAQLKKREEQGVGNGGNDLTPQDLKDLEEMQG